MAVKHTCTVLLLFFSIVVAHNFLPHEVTSRKLSTKPAGYQTLYLDAETYKRVRAEVLAAASVPSEKLWSMEVIHRDSLFSSATRRNPSATLTDAKVSFIEALPQRLERNAARVSAIANRIKVAQEGGMTAEWQPAAIFSSQEEFSSPITPGASQGVLEYLTRLGIGTPAQEAYFMMDTGSDLSWTQCEPCAKCYSQSDPLFNPTQSSSYTPVSCSAPLCSLLSVRDCQSDQCLYGILYGTGSSFTVGDLAVETLTFGNSPVPQLPFGCGRDNEGFKVFSGILGLGAGQLSVPSQIGQPFSYCLTDYFSSSTSESDLVFGSGSVLSGAAAFTPLLKNAKIPTFYYVELQGISVAGSLLNIPPSVFTLQSSGTGGVVLDSGTSITTLVTPAYTALRDAFRAGAANLPPAGSTSNFDTCYALGSMSSAAVPRVDLHFAGGTTLALPPANYLIPVDTAGTYCLAFTATNNNFSIIGNIQQQGYRVSYDTAGAKVGFAADQC